MKFEPGIRVWIMAEAIEKTTVKKTEFVLVRIEGRENPIWVPKTEIVWDEDE